MLETWLLQREQEGDAAVRQEVSDARKRLEEDRKRWVGDVIGSISQLAHLDATFFRAPMAWVSGDPASPMNHNPRLDATAPHAALLQRGDHHPGTQDKDNEKRTKGGRKLEVVTGNRDRVELSWAGIQARHDRDPALPSVRQKHGGEDAESGPAAPQPRGTAGGDKDDFAHSQPAAETAAAAEVEALAAEQRCARLEALAGLAREGLAAHWRSFFCDEIERTRMAATALDISASRWAQRQREAVGVLRASWRGRDWESTATSGGAGGGSDGSRTSKAAGVSAAAGSGAEEGSAMHGAGAPSTPLEAATATSPAVRAGAGGVEGADTVTAAHLSTQATGRDTFSEKEEGTLPDTAANAGTDATSSAGGETAPVKSNREDPGEHEASPSTVDCDASTIGVEGDDEGEGDQREDVSGTTAAEPEEGAAGTRQSVGGGGDDDSAYVIVIREADAWSTGGLQVAPSDAQVAEATAAAGQLVVFVGRAMAFHTSTIRSSYLENFHEENRRHRLSSFSALPQRGQQGHRYRSLPAYITPNKTYSRISKRSLEMVGRGCLPFVALSQIGSAVNISSGVYHPVSQHAASPLG